MDTINVKCSRVHIAASKVRLVADLVREKKVSDALQILRFCEKREIGIVVSKLVNSAMAIASTRNTSDLDRLTISSIRVNEGSTLVRVQARARGRAFQIKKRTCHIELSLKEQ